MTDDELAKQRQTHGHADTQGHHGIKESVALGVRLATTHPVLVLGAWLAVGIPLAYGLWYTLQKAVVLFK